MANGKGEKNSNNSGCSFGKVTREKVENVEKTFEDFRKNDFHSLRETVDNIRDKLLGRLSPSVAALITILGSVTAALVVYGAMK